jgi:drug/metabolite transporter (DMT)-like permease
MINILIFIALCLIWGSTWLAIKIGLEGSPPFLGAGFRFAISTAFLLLISVLSGGFDITFRGKLRQVIIAGILIYPIPYGLVYWGSQYVESGMAAVLFAIMPFFVAILANKYLPSERLTVLKLFGMGLGFGGILIIFADNMGARGILGVLGMAAVSGSSLFSAIGTIYSKKYFNDIDPLAMTAFQSFIGAVVLTIIGFAFESVADYRFDARTIGSLFYLGILGTAAAFTLYFYALKKMETTNLAMIAFITPVVALILGVIFRNEIFDLLSIIGSLMVILGVFIVVAGKRVFGHRAGSRESGHGVSKTRATE